MNSRKLKPDKRFFFRLDAHYRVMIALAFSLVTFFCLNGKITTPALILVVWMACALTIILLNWIIIFSSHPREVRRIAKLQDSSLTFIFMFVTAASIASLGAIIYLLKSTKGLPYAAKNEHILLAIGAVIISWFLLHTIYTLRYAHLYYDTDTDIDGKTKDVGGLQFPGKDEPDYLDFVYFSFIVGMTFQVSDVNITSRRIRRVCTLHALLAFAFNTAILALSINVISGMVSQ
ncbi:MAG TPA: DUF1345 domain-containing protein [Mucilaginibacter sp.]|jgi:uncharacterized membrane protein|nr:DUF1345 domain-containing protein [Mucilaginibacter sp.]